MFAQKYAVGRCASAEFFRSSSTCSMISVPAMDFVGDNGVKFCRVGGGEERVESPHVEQLALS